MSGWPLTQTEQESMRQLCLTVRGMVSALRLARVDEVENPDDDLRVAKARLENWLSENDSRWVK